MLKNYYFLKKSRDGKKNYRTSSILELGYMVDVWFTLL